jgi:4-amino-4-deoxy-L-arabinose transferase-like glycosyltransferase
MRRFFREHKIEIVLFILALVLRLIFFLICLEYNNGNIQDTIHGQDGYFEISKNLFEGHGFSASAGPMYPPYSYGVPVYPYFLFWVLLFTGGSYWVTGMLQLILGACIPLLGMKISKMVLPQYQRVAIIVGVLLAISPFQILFSFIFYTETLFTVLFAVFLILYFKFLRNPSIVLAATCGAVLGLSTLTKATVQYIPLIAVVFALYHFKRNINRRLIYQMGVFVVIFLMVLAPWLYRNYSTFGKAVLSTQMPFNIYGVLYPSILAIDNGTSFRVEQDNLNVNGGELMSNLSKSQELAEMAVKEIMKRPVAFVQLGLLSSITFLSHDGMLTFLQAAGIRPHTYLPKPATIMLLESPVEFMKIVVSYAHTSMAFVFLARIFWTCLAVLFLYGLYKAWRTKDMSTELIFSIIVIFYFMGTTMINGLAVNARFRMPIEMVYFSLSVLGASYIVAWIKNKYFHE